MPVAADGPFVLLAQSLMKHLLDTFLGGVTYRLKSVFGEPRSNVLLFTDVYVTVGVWNLSSDSWL